MAQTATSGAQQHMALYGLAMQARRHTTRQVMVGGVAIGGGAPVRIQSMTNTDTADIEATAAQIIELAKAGSELVRITVDREEAARAVPHIRDHVRKKGCDVPIIGDFHYIGHILLRDHPACAEALDKYRINPGNVGFGAKQDRNFSAIIDIALKHDKPVRIGANWGSLDKALLDELMQANAARKTPKSAREVMHEALVQSCLRSAARAQALGLPPERIILSAKVSEVPDLIAVYRALAQSCDLALHLGLTEAGMGEAGIIASAAGLSVLLAQGIGDTIRVSITPEPGAARTREVKVAQQILQALQLRSFRPHVIACPGCGRTTSSRFQELAQEITAWLDEMTPSWRAQYPGFEQLQVAVMGCIVNGPGESKHADIGISLPGTGEAPAAPVFMDGRKVATLRGEDLAGQFKQLVADYVARRWGNEGAAQ